MVCLHDKMPIRMYLYGSPGDILTADALLSTKPSANYLGHAAAANRFACQLSIKRRLKPTVLHSSAVADVTVMKIGGGRGRGGGVGGGGIS